MSLDVCVIRYHKLQYPCFVARPHYILRKNDVQEPQMEFKKGREFTEWVIRPDWKDEIRKTFFKRGQMM